MLLAGIICHDGICETANLINSFFTNSGIKVSITDFKSLAGLDNRKIKIYIRELAASNIDILIFKINIGDFGNEALTSIHFDIMIYSQKPEEAGDDRIEDSREAMKQVFGLLDEKGIAIVNVDDDELIGFLEEMKYNVITYGFNSRASMTTSSVGDKFFKDSFLCCLQKTLATKNGTLVEPQEYRVNLPSSDADAYQVLAAATFAVLNDLDLNKLN